jgi:hypothetical protein
METGMKSVLGLILSAAIALPQVAVAQDETGEQDRIRQLVVYGADPCPPSVGDEIVVCARKPEGERYRIPKDLREEAQEPSPESQSWTSRVESMEYVGATGIQSCSTVGPGGNIGCWQQLMRQAREERRAKQRSQSNIP